MLKIPKGTEQEFNSHYLTQKIQTFSNMPPTSSCNYCILFTTKLGIQKKLRELFVVLTIWRRNMRACQMCSPFRCALLQDSRWLNHFTEYYCHQKDIPRKVKSRFPSVVIANASAPSRCSTKHGKRDLENKIKMWDLILENKTFWLQ